MIDIIHEKEDTADVQLITEAFDKKVGHHSLSHL